MIRMNNMNSDTNQPKSSLDIVTLGERGQIVIPASVRERFHLEAGDKLMIFCKGQMIGLMPTEQLRAHVDELATKLAAMEEEVEQSTPEEK